MACSRYQLFYGNGGALSATYQICGDYTPTLVTATGGVSGALYLSAGPGGFGAGIINAIVGSVITYTGFASAGGAPVQGTVYPYVLAPWAAYTIGNAVSALSARGV